MRLRSQKQQRRRRQQMWHGPHLSKRASVRAMVACSARAGAEPSSYCNKGETRAAVVRWLPVCQQDGRGALSCCDSGQAGRRRRSLPPANRSPGWLSNQPPLRLPAALLRLHGAGSGICPAAGPVASCAPAHWPGQQSVRAGACCGSWPCCLPIPAAGCLLARWHSRSSGACSGP